MRFYYTAIYTDKKTGTVLFRLDYPVIRKQGVTDPNEIKSLNKFFWEKEKAVTLDKLVKNRFLDKANIVIKEYEGQL